MSVRYPKDIDIPPEDFQALEREMADKPGDWRVLSAYPDTGTYTLVTDAGDGKHLIGCKIQLDTEPLFEINQEDLNDSQNRRFPDEVCVARIPEHLLFANEGGNIGKAVAEDDWNHVKKVLNDPDFRKFRSFRGRL